VDQEKIKRKSMEFSIPKHLNLSSIVIPFYLDVTKSRGLLEIKVPKEGIKVPHGLLDLFMTQLLQGLK